MRKHYRVKPDGAYKADSMPIGGAQPEPGGMFPIFLASRKTPEGAFRGSPLSWACAKCKAYMEENVMITPSLLPEYLWRQLRIVDSYKFEQLHRIFLRQCPGIAYVIGPSPGAEHPRALRKVQFAFQSSAI